VIARLAAILLAAFLIGTPAGFAHAQGMTPEQRNALNAAERWLVPVDAQRYADAWAMSAASFKGSVDRTKFRDGMRDLRKEYGRVVLRKAEKMAFVGSRPAPEDSGPKEGAQLSILFDTKFVRNRQATEEVLMELEKDGLWRVAGYYIR
jgi:hypothetical protein